MQTRLQKLQEWVVSDAWVSDYKRDQWDQWDTLFKLYLPKPSKTNQSDSCKVSTSIHSSGLLHSYNQAPRNDEYLKLTINKDAGTWENLTTILLETATFVPNEDSTKLCSDLLDISEVSGKPSPFKYTHVQFEITYEIEPDGKKKFFTTANWLNPNPKSAVDVGPGTGYPWKEP